MADQLRGGVLIEQGPKRTYAIVDYTEEGGTTCYCALVFLDDKPMGLMSFGHPQSPMGVTVCWWPAKAMLRDYLTPLGWQERTPSASALVRP